MTAMARAPATATVRPAASRVRPPSLRVPEAVVQRCGGRACPGGACHGDHEEGAAVQRRPAGGELAGPGTGAAASVPESVHDALRSPGHALNEPVRAAMETRFGHDFGAVRVHTDSRAAASASAVDAVAYTVGRHIVFGPARYAPGTDAGQRLLAHELTHVVQQRASGSGPGPVRIGAADSPAEREAEAAEHGAAVVTVAGAAHPVARAVQRRVRRENVSCRENGLTNPDLTGDEVVAALEAADADAIALAQGAEDALAQNLADVRAGGAVDPDFDTILQEELGLTLANPAQFGLVEQQRNRFRRVRETLESGYLRYMCRGGTVSLVGCAQATCEPGDFAFACAGNRLVVLCQAFWTDPPERPGTLLHEPFHIWFQMAHFDPGGLRRADASCFESFARRVAGEAAPPLSCVGHTAG